MTSTKPTLEPVHTTDQTTPTPDPFNVEALRLPPSFEQTAGIKKLITTILARKPHSQEWIRVHPDPEYRGDFATIFLKEDREFYLLKPEVAEDLRSELTAVTIYTAMNRNGVLFLWPVKRAGSDGRRADHWHTSAHEAASAAMKRSVRVRANMGLGAYEIDVSDNPTPENDPVWPDLPFSEMLRIAFFKTGCFVDNFDHPVIKMLRGL
jgi:hypothetical protein